MYAPDGPYFTMRYQWYLAHCHPIYRVISHHHPPITQLSYSVSLRWKWKFTFQLANVILPAPLLHNLELSFSFQKGCLKFSRKMGEGFTGKRVHLFEINANSWIWLFPRWGWKAVVFGWSSHNGAADAWGQKHHHPHQEGHKPVILHFHTFSVIRTIWH